jgi:hypothetical protein
MLGAVAGHTAGQDLAAFVDGTAQAVDILIINVFNLAHAEIAHLAAGAFSTGTGALFATIFRHNRFPPSFHDFR